MKVLHLENPLNECIKDWEKIMGIYIPETTKGLIKKEKRIAGHFSDSKNIYLVIYLKISLI